MVVDVTSGAALECSEWCRPLRRVRVGAQDVYEVAAAAEEPDFDGTARPLHGIDAALAIVEAIAVGAGAAGLQTASLIPLAILLDHGASAAGMHRHCILGLVADALNDVDFAAVGPIGSGHPKGRPDATGIGRHMLKIENDKAMRV